MFTIRDIKGAVVEKKTRHESWCAIGKNTAGCTCYGDIFNKAIDAQSSVQLQFNREKLARICYEDATGREWGCGDSFRHALAYKLADAIIAAEKELLEVVT